MMNQRVAARWQARQAANDLTVDYVYAHGYATLHGTGDIQDVITALKQSVMRRIPEPGNVPKIRGAVKAFSFHWSNAQNAWDVIAIRDFPWGIDGAEFILFVGADALSPLGKVWTLTEMKYVAKGLPRHPRAPSATNWGLRSAGRTLKNPTTIEVVCEDGDGAKAVMEVLRYLKWCGDVGHSCGLIDPDDGNSNHKVVCSFDGDGADYIDTIKQDGKKAERWHE